MKRNKKVLAILLAFGMMFLFTGCWNYHELETLQVVAGVAIDPGQNGFKYHMTFECVKMSGGQQGGGGGGPEPIILESDGNTVFDAVRNTLNESDKKLYFSHCKIVVLNKKIAQDGLKALVDWFIRDAEPRATLQFLVSEEPTAGEILKQKPKSGDITSFQINSSLEESENAAGECTTEELYQINNILNTDGVELTLPEVQIHKEQSSPSVEKTANQGGVSSGSGSEQTSLMINGNAIFRDGKLIGNMDRDQAKYSNFLLGRIKGGLLLTGEKPNDRTIALEILSSSTKYTPKVQNGVPSMDIAIRTAVAYGEQNTTKDILQNEGIDKIESIAEKTIQSNAESVIKLAQQKYDSDIFGFGTKFQQDKPGDWDKLKSKWPSEFPKMKCSVKVTVNISNLATTVAKGGE